MRALVTGGAGFIGSHLAERLLRDGHEVRVLDNMATGRRENILPFAGKLELVEGDIQSYERVHNAVRGMEIVFHQAALPSVPRSVQDPLTRIAERPPPARSVSRTTATPSRAGRCSAGWRRTSALSCERSRGSARRA